MFVYMLTKNIMSIFACVFFMVLDLRFVKAVVKHPSLFSWFVALGAVAALHFSLDNVSEFGPY